MTHNDGHGPPILGPYAYANMISEAKEIRTVLYLPSNRYKSVQTEYKSGQDRKAARAVGRR